MDDCCFCFHSWIILNLVHRMWVLDDTLLRQFILLTLFWALNFTDNRITLITDMDMTIKLVVIQTYMPLRMQYMIILSLQ